MRIGKNEIVEYAKRYELAYEGTTGEEVEKRMKLLLREQRYLTRDDFIEIGLWKSRRPKPHYESLENDDLTVGEVTRFSFGARSERARIESLLMLKGVSWPVASTILHFAFPGRYPIMDFRVIRSLRSLGWNGKKPQSYEFNFWMKYCNKIRSLARTHKLPIRTVEKALWKLDKEGSKKHPRGSVSS